MCFTGRVIMVLEEQRFIHEDLERLEQAIADRVVDEPRNVSLSAFRDWRFLICFVCVCVDPGTTVSRSRGLAFPYTYRRAIETSA